VSTQAFGSDMVHSIALPLPEITVPDEVLHTAERLGVVEYLPQVLEISREVFGDEFTLRVLEDPELEDWTHIAVAAAVEGTAEALLDKEDAWFDAMSRRIGKPYSAFTLLTTIE
jgi:hypothetical protein